MSAALDLAADVTFEQCRFSALRDEGRALFLQHWLEASADHHLALDVDWDAFSRIEDAGAQVCVAARRGGMLIGYAVYVVYPHLHYRGWVVGDSDVYFLDPADRIGWVGVRLLREAEAALAARGVDEIWQRAKLHVRTGRGRSDLGPLFRYLGYRAVETVWRKRIG